MKTFNRTDALKSLTVKKVSLSTLFFLTLVLLLISGCEKEEPGIRLVYPALSTAPVINVTGTAATTGGNVASDGGFPVTARGICWATTANPSLAASVTIDGNGTGEYVSSLNGLTPGTVYHVRAYATNSQGTAYGADISFTTASAGK
jgi:hypothetical protein